MLAMNAKTLIALDQANCIPCPQPRLCPLSRVRAGVSVRIRQLSGPPDVAQRLREIGMGEDQVVRLVTSRANIICEVCHSRLAISAGVADAILVEPVFGMAA